MEKRVKNKSGVPKFKVLFRILEILHSYKSAKAGNIQRILDGEGLLPSKNRHSARRLLNYYLKELEELGFVEREGGGRNTSWLLKRPFIPNKCRLLPHQKGLVLLLLLLGEELFLKTLGGELESIAARLGLNPEMLPTLRRDITFKYLYGVDIEPHLTVLGRIVEAIECNCYVQVLLAGKRERFLKLLPLGIGLRNGRVYLFALRGERRIYIPLDRIKNISLLTWEKVEGKGAEVPPGRYLLCPKEKPFIFGVKPKGSGWGRDRDLSFHPLVFHSETDPKGNRLLYLVGFTGDYFASRFLPHLGEPLSPDRRMLAIARKKGVKDLFPPMPLGDLSYHRNLYGDFLKRVREQLADRLDGVSRALKSLSSYP